MNGFKKDPYYLLKSFGVNIVLFSFLILLLLSFKPLVEVNFSVLSLLLIPLGLILGLVSATAFHNASHGNIKPRYLNRLIGELTASLSLEDLRCFRVGHMLHHIHTDDPLLDPHPPQGLKFFEFIVSSRRKTISCIENLYYKHHGKTVSSMKNVKFQIFFFHIAAVLKLVFWFYLFGPASFLLFFIPSYLAYFFGFAHLNYISHQEDRGDGTIYNHNDNLFFKGMNIVTSGGYFHKNHHACPGLYNPSKLTR